ncbi:MAG: flagellar biosynthesis protein FlhA [Thiobacillus sp. 65-29]|nr:MAG: flagellar biosynthesis protein FlhA [Thiobacillus sp. 65-29]
MNGNLTFSSLFTRANARALAAPVFILLVLAMLVLPLPPIALDMLFTFNIALSIMVLLVSLSTRKALDFAAFPTVLLLATLLRLSLNVASTRVVLMEGHTGPDAAGKVIEAFGHFLVGGNYTVGIIVFLILVVINFIVITKGAGRIAEVSARFTLDAMPGKQMAIDADLNAGLIDETEARRRRAEIGQESDFYGSMDGASKFVRGDAIAGILILVINIVGGLLVGLLQHNLSLDEAAHNYTLLAIGDGLVAQIPALVISIAAGIIVSRVSTEEDIAGQVMSNVFSKVHALYITAAILGLMGMIPGMPNFAFLALAGALVWLATTLVRKQQQPAEPAIQEAPAAAVEAQEATWEDVAPIDTLGLEVGYRLIPLVDSNTDAELVRRIKGIRKKFAREIGFLPPAVHIRDNLDINPNGYRITLKGVEIGSGDVRTGMFLAIDPGNVTAALPGVATRDPAFGLPAVWVDAAMREQATAMGYTVVDPGTVIATHLNHLVTLHAAELLGRQETQALLDHLGKSAPKLVEDLVPKMLPVSTVQKVLQTLLAEGVAIRDMRTILDILLEHAGRVQDPNELTALVRVGLGRSIVQQIYGPANELPVIALEQNLERVLMQTLQGGQDAALEPGLADTLLERAQSSAQRQEALGHPPVLLTPAVLRPLLARFLRRAVPQLKVLSHAEVPEGKQIRVTSLVGGTA